MQEIKVLVPEARVAEFYGWFSEWLSGRPTEAPKPEVAPAAFESPDEHDLLGRAVAWWKSMKKRERELFGLWIDEAPRAIPAPEIVERLGLKNTRVIPGILAWPGRRAEKVGFPLDWVFTLDADGVPAYGLKGIEHEGIRLTVEEYAELLAEARRRVEA